MNRAFLLLPLLALLAGIGLPGTAGVALASSVPDHVVISEVCVRGPDGSYDEFVELYNPTDLELNLEGWKLQYKPATGGNWSSRVGEKGLPAGSRIKPHGFFLLAGKSYAGSVEPDFRHTANWGLKDEAGHVRLINAAGTEIDRVGYGEKANSPEMSPAPTPPSGGSIERRSPCSGCGPCQDTKNNAADFQTRPVPSPMNSARRGAPPLPGTSLWAAAALVAALAAALLRRALRGRPGKLKLTGDFPQRYNQRHQKAGSCQPKPNVKRGNGTG